MRMGSLFSGIGGLELGLESTGLGHTVWQVECDPWCRATLARHWPDAERFDDVHAVGAFNLDPVDLVCGGFPCQDVSSAGARAGLAGSRSGLWHEYRRVIFELRPEWVVVENVASGARLWVDDVCEGLEQLGYATLPVPVCADWLGAPYERARIFVVGRRPVADAHRDGEPAVSVDAEVARASSVARVADGAREAADADRIELRKQHRGLCGSHGEAAPVALVDRWREPMPLVDGVVSRAPRRLAQHAAGNCVVPAQAAVIGFLIQELVMVKLEQNPVISGSSVLA